MTIPTYTPQDWYWAVGGSSEDVYSSARAGYVPVADADYLAWIERNNRPTPIGSEAELWEVLWKQYPAGIAPDNAEGQDALREVEVERIPPQMRKWFLDIENRVRALEGQPAGTAAQLKSHIKGL